MRNGTTRGQAPSATPSQAASQSPIAVSSQLSLNPLKIARQKRAADNRRSPQPGASRRLRARASDGTAIATSRAARVSAAVNPARVTPKAPLVHLAPRARRISPGLPTRAHDLPSARPATGLPPGQALGRPPRIRRREAISRSSISIGTKKTRNRSSSSRKSQFAVEEVSAAASKRASSAKRRPTRSAKATARSTSAAASPATLGADSLAVALRRRMQARMPDNARHQRSAPPESKRLLKQQGSGTNEKRRPNVAPPRAKAGAIGSATRPAGKITANRPRPPDPQSAASSATSAANGPARSKRRVSNLVARMCRWSSGASKRNGDRHRRSPSRLRQSARPQESQKPSPIQPPPRAGTTRLISQPKRAIVAGNTGEDRNHQSDKPSIHRASPNRSSSLKKL